MSVKEGIVQLATDGKVAATTALITTSTGISSWLDFIPDDIGKLGTLVGFSATIIFTYIQIKKYKLDQQDKMLDFKLKRQQLRKNSLEMRQEA